MSAMAEVRQEVFPGDERAAGVISGSDPYRELELYLEQVSEEFGEVFERWLGGEAAGRKVSTLPRAHNTNHGNNLPPVPPVRTKRSRLLAGGTLPVGKPSRIPLPPNPPPMEWTDSVMEDFDMLIAKELSQLEREVKSSASAPSSPPAKPPTDVHLFPIQTTEPVRRSSDSELPKRMSSPEKIKAFFRTTSSFGRRNKKQPKKRDATLETFLTELRPPPGDDSSDQDSGLDSVLASSASRDLVSTATQTSPALSRSSSFTWLSDCSSLAPDDKTSSNSSSTSSSPSRSPSQHGEDDSLDSSPDSFRAHRPILRNKCGRKDPWDRLRRRGVPRPFAREVDVWVRRESVHTQTADNSPVLPPTPDDEEDDSVAEQGEGLSEDCLVIAGLPPRPRTGGSLPRVLHLPLTKPQAAPPAPQLPSPSSASLKLVAAPLPPDLCNKSSSAPIIMKKPAAKAGEDSTAVKQPRSQSERHLAEIEAAETCKWLRAAGFPQYAQMFEDLQFPIDVSSVQKDHPFLDLDSIQSLFRRLQTLNRCARVKIESSPNNQTDESDEEGDIALSENWTFQPESRRWSRVCEVTAERLQRLQANGHDEASDSAEPAPESEPVRFRRTGSERLRDGAKALLRRVESLKARRRAKPLRQRRTDISQPQVLDVASMQQRVVELQCVDVSPQVSLFGDDSSSYCSSQCSDQSSDGWGRARGKWPRPRCVIDALSDTEATSTTSQNEHILRDKRSSGTRSLPRGGSLNLGAQSQRFRDQVNQSLRRPKDCCHELSGSSEPTEDSSSTLASQPDSDQETNPMQKASVVRWHSFHRAGRPSSRPWLSSDVCARAMSALSSGQLLVLRKLALLKLTACMERHCPSHRTGWDWDLPKFIRKMKPPDYKDKSVFGVPLVVSLQRSGQSLPASIQAALRWLRANALDQVGIFRKSGVRSRIQTLKVLTEHLGEEVSFDGQQAYDVADMVKQYFRDLPEALVTSKLSDTFLSIFQNVPVEQQRDAVQWAVLLLPDEHREALQVLVEFLHQVSARSDVNQMTASNLAVCLAPSLFHLHNTSPSPGTSPRRRKPTGAPDQKELCSNKAAHDCLVHLIREPRLAFVVSEPMFRACRFSTLEASVPMTLAELGGEQAGETRRDLRGGGWRDFMQDSIHAFLKEVREKSRGWVNLTCHADGQTDVAYKKVRDGHPLRLWRVSTDVEAPPRELLRRVLRERHVWDPSLLKWRVVARLDPQAEVFQYVCASMPPLPAKDYCVLRCWRGDLAKGACVVVETSVEHEGAPVMEGGVRGVVLASRYLIEPCGSGKSRIIHLSRVDTKGRSPEWYNRSYGHICAMQLSKIRQSFIHSADGPESKV